MRLIDADALVKWIERQKRLSKLCTIMAIQETPAIDAVPVVRCKDCKHMAKMINACHCKVWGHFNGYGEGGFCSYGERKE